MRQETGQHSLITGPTAPAPTGFVDNKSDCCDRDAHAKPGQTEYFTQADVCGSFDYDCSGAPSLRLAAAFTGCSFDSVCAANGFGTPCGREGARGWGLAASDTLGRSKAFTAAATAIPSCGQAGTFVNGCERVSNCAQDNCACGHKNACIFDVITGVKQSCR